MANDCRIYPSVCGTNALHLYDIECESTEPAYIKITTLPQTEYVVDEEHQLPLPVNFDGAVVKVYDENDELWTDIYADGIIPHSDLDYNPKLIEAGRTDPGAYYDFEGDGNWIVVNTQRDDTGGAVCGPVGARFCAIKSGTDQYVVGVWTEPFQMRKATWDGLRELGSLNAYARQYDGVTYYVTNGERWWGPAPDFTVNYTMRDTSKDLWEQAIEICYGGHKVDSEKTITVSWEYNGTVFTDSYEIHVH